MTERDIREEKVSRPPVINGKPWLAGLLCSAQDIGGIDGRTRLQKLTFLAQERIDHRAYRFDPTHSGPYSRRLDEDVDQLIREGFIDECERTNEDGMIHYIYRATDEMREYVSEFDDDDPRNKALRAATVVVNKYGDEPLMDLLDHVAVEYPMMAKNMEVR